MVVVPLIPPAIVAATFSDRRATLTLNRRTLVSPYAIGSRIGVNFNVAAQIRPIAINDDICAAWIRIELCTFTWHFKRLAARFVSDNSSEAH
jgi:hypothetical protein